MKVAQSILVATLFMFSNLSFAASASSVVGTWNTFINWSCDSSTSVPTAASDFIVNADGTWSYAFGGGRWWQREGLTVFSFTSYPALQYVGNVTKDAIVGIQGYSSSTTFNGCFYFTRARPVSAGVESVDEINNQGIDFITSPKHQ